jgi:hypothetical protein
MEKIAGIAILFVIAVCIYGLIDVIKQINKLK